MLGALRRHAANLLTGTRVLLVPVLVSLILEASASRAPSIGAAAVFALAATSDFLDGRAARRWGRPSPAGRVFDHFTDITFLLVVLGTYVHLGVAPWWVPVSIFAAFAFYVIDSRRRSSASPSLLTSRLGHLGGVCNYILVGVLVGNETLGLHVLPESLLSGFFGLVPIYSFAGMIARLVGR